MSIFETLFGKAPAATPAAQNPVASETPASVAANPTVPSAANAMPPQNTPPAPEAPKSPLDGFSDLWKNDPKSRPAPQQSFVFDPAKLAEAATKVDFTKVVTPDLMQKIQAGGADAVAATMQAMNSMAQATYAQSAHAASQLVDEALSKSRQQFMEALPTHIRKAQASDALRTDNPLFSNPAVAPILGALEAQITRKFPNATAQEIRQQAQSYLSGLAEVIQAPNKPQEVSAKKGETDWSKFLG